jgi:hypothetical protein
MNIVNLLEVHYANIRSLGKEQAAVILEKIFYSPIQIVSDVSDTVFQQSAHYNPLTNFFFVVILSLI